MKLCDEHALKLFEAIEERGLGHLISKSDEEAQAAMTSKTTVEPVLMACSMLAERIYWLYGEVVLGQNDDGTNDGEYCPLCLPRAMYDHHNTPTGRCDDPECNIHVEAGQPPWDEMMLEGCCNAVLAFCQHQGLTTPLQ